MQVSFSGRALAAQSDWDTLARLISKNPSAGPLPSLLAHLKDGGARYAIIESGYLDRDFTAEFVEFYAKLFHRYTKVCKRIHFFAEDMSAVIGGTDPEKVVSDIEALKEKYLGFMVVRPIQHAPVARTVIAAPKSLANTKSHVLVESDYDVHFLGARLRVTGMPFMQQDSRVGACAQAAIWMAARHFHSKHRGPWLSVAQITQEASKPVDSALSLSLPAGSAFLSSDNMVRALRAAGREPLLYAARVPSLNPLVIQWQPPDLRPADIVHRYVDSGIPVILGIAPSPGGPPIGHAALVIGHTIQNLDPKTPLPPRPTRSEFCQFFLVNDDQSGAALRMPLKSGAPGAETSYSMEQVSYVLVPLPAKVYVAGEIAERAGWDKIERYAASVQSFKKDNKFPTGAAEAQAQALIDAISNNEVVARTYLTYGWRYRERLVHNICAPTIKKAVWRHDLPRFVWVTEFGTKASLNHINARDRRIFAHSVVDATSSQYSDETLFFHAPGMVQRLMYDSALAQYDFKFIPVPDETPYFPKARGHRAPP